MDINRDNDLRPDLDTEDGNQHVYYERSWRWSVSKENYESAETVLNNIRPLG